MTTANSLLFSPYAPVRYQNQSWWRYAQEVAKQGRITAEGLLVHKQGDPLDFYARIEQEYLIPYAKTFIQVMQAQPDGASTIGVGLAQLYGVLDWVPLCSQYELCGRQIFDVSAALSSMLSRTSVADCTLEGWQPPYDAFFLRFGKQEQARLPFIDETSEFEYLDGAFVAVSPCDTPHRGRRVRFGLTTVRDSGEGMTLPGYFLDFFPDTEQLPIPEAIEKALERWLKVLTPADTASPQEKAFCALRQDRFREAAELIREAALLIFNALFYIETLPPAERAALSPGRDVPEALLRQWDASPPKNQRKLTSKLTREGYAVVRMLGKEYDAMPAPGAGSTEPVATHWRRGHWRQQRHGPALALVHRIWIKPVLVNPLAKEVGAELPGHIYQVPDIRH